VTPDDAITATDDAPELLRTALPDGPGAPDDPISEDDPDDNDRNPYSPRSDVSGDQLVLEKGLPDEGPVNKGGKRGNDNYLPLTTSRQNTSRRNAGRSTVPAPSPASANLTPTEVTRRLRALGFRIRSTGEREQAIRAFKTGWYKLGPSLLEGTVANSIMGPRASKAIDLAFQRSKDGLSTMSPNFSFSDTACACGGNFTDCRVIWPTRTSVIAAEALRAAVFPAGLSPLSWCRCTGHNTLINGAASTRHLKGDALDLPATAPLHRVVALDIFTGIGVDRDRMVRHVDLRPGASVSPTVWYYD